MRIDSLVHMRNKIITTVTVDWCKWQTQLNKWGIDQYNNDAYEYHKLNGFIFKFRVFSSKLTQILLTSIYLYDVNTIGRLKHSMGQ